MEEKTRLLISLGAAFAANCLPCYEYYYAQAKDFNLSEDEIKEATEIGAQMKTGADLSLRSHIGQLKQNPGTGSCQGCGPAATCC